MHLFILTQNLTDPFKYLPKDKQTNKTPSLISQEVLRLPTFT